METGAIALTWSLFHRPHRATPSGMAITLGMTTMPTIGMTAAPTTAMHAATATEMACLTVTTAARTIRIDAEGDKAPSPTLSLPHLSSRSTKCPFEPL